ncbi:MAG: molybdopterin-dependent oxidoreductase [Kiloniellaceae bacterium]
MGKGSMSIYRFISQSLFRRARLGAALAALCVALAAPVAGSAEGVLGTPAGEPLLSVAGRIANTNAAGAAHFDRAMLAALPQHEIRTSTEWTDGVKVFRGPLVRDVLAAVGASGETAVATAVNDYAVEIPLSDFAAYPVVLAMSMDGETLSLRNKGPLWIVYPRDDHAALRNSEMNSRWIWQLRSLEIR